VEEKGKIETSGGLEVKPSNQTQVKRVVIANAFSVNMIPNTTSIMTLRFKRINLETAKNIVKDARGNYLSIIGHEATAILLSNLLDVEISINRANYIFNPNDLLLVFTIPFRLPEGRTLTYEEIKKVKDTLNIFVVEAV